LRHGVCAYFDRVRATRNRSLDLTLDVTPNSSMPTCGFRFLNRSSWEKKQATPPSTEYHGHASVLVVLTPADVTPLGCNNCNCSQRVERQKPMINVIASLTWCPQAGGYYLSAVHWWRSVTVGQLFASRLSSSLILLLLLLLLQTRIGGDVSCVQHWPKNKRTLFNAVANV